MTDAGAVRVEIGVESLAGVRIADAAGATRVELCTGLSVGGLTPSTALVRAAVETADDVQIHVLIRPRPGISATPPMRWRSCAPISSRRARPGRTAW